MVYISPLKALAVDVERNLRSPLAGIANEAQRRGVVFHTPEISVRTGDTPQKERSRFRRHPAEILITTPESLYLLLTSDAAASLRSVDTVIVDEIHALVPTKRGAHLALSLERLQAICEKPLQRIGLSATQRPLEEVAHFLRAAIASGPAGEETKRSHRRIGAATPNQFRLLAIAPLRSSTRASQKSLSCALRFPLKTWRAWDRSKSCPAGRLRRGRNARRSGVRSIRGF